MSQALSMRLQEIISQLSPVVRLLAGRDDERMPIEG